MNTREFEKYLLIYLYSYWNKMKYKEACKYNLITMLTFCLKSSTITFDRVNKLLFNKLF